MKTIDAMKEVLENNKEFKNNYEGEECILKKIDNEIRIVFAKDETMGFILERVHILRLEGWEAL